jgi:tyrosinase
MLNHQQAVQGAALQVALDYPTVWQEAAARLRIPYWDWATDALPPREVWQQTHIEIRVPGLDGSTDPLTVPNPLYSYKFQEPVPYLKGAEPDTETVRHSDSPDHSAFVE